MARIQQEKETRNSSFVENNATARLVFLNKS